MHITSCVYLNKQLTINPSIEHMKTRQTPY